MRLGLPLARSHSYVLHAPQAHGVRQRWYVMGEASPHQDDRPTTTRSACYMPAVHVHVLGELARHGRFPPSGGGGTCRRKSMPKALRARQRGSGRGFDGAHAPGARRWWEYATPPGLLAIYAPARTDRSEPQSRAAGQARHAKTKRAKTRTVRVCAWRFASQRRNFHHSSV